MRILDFYLCGFALIASAFPYQNSLTDEEVVQIYRDIGEVPNSQNLKDFIVWDPELTDVPVSVIRAKRQTEGYFGGREKLFESDGHRVDALGYISKQCDLKGPTGVGGGLDYSGPRGSASISVDHQLRMGTSLQAQGSANLWKSNDGRSSVYANANYQRQFGSQGTSSDNTFFGIGAKYRF